ncbi:MAG: hypothetical protein ACI8W1_001398 [Candidatus Azotimanducaceae bacterium]|jgi:hypothetical protein
MISDVVIIFLKFIEHPALASSPCLAYNYSLPRFGIRDPRFRNPVWNLVCFYAG